MSGRSRGTFREAALAHHQPQYSGYLPGSPIFFWFFPSRSHPATDPVGIWSNGGPGSSALTGMQYAGPCMVVDDGQGGWTMKRREWSFNDAASILMLDNVRCARDGADSSPLARASQSHLSPALIQSTILPKTFMRLCRCSFGPFPSTHRTHGRSTRCPMEGRCESAAALIAATTPPRTGLTSST